ncbi:MAG TPA: hypothetical protein VFU31_02295 [Candidatus Binatia bacterium]|nr:hypothetical protein [Candidatus Binatia bacterium]
MPGTTNAKLSTLALVLLLTTLGSMPLRAEETIEKAAVAVGVTAGNMWFIPIKAITVSMGMLSGALSYVVTGGNVELTRQIWQDTSQGPYVITPKEVKQAIGERPELLEAK